MELIIQVYSSKIKLILLIPIVFSCVKARFEDISTVDWIPVIYDWLPDSIAKSVIIGVNWVPISVGVNSVDISVEIVSVVDFVVTVKVDSLIVDTSLTVIVEGINWVTDIVVGIAVVNVT